MDSSPRNAYQVAFTAFCAIVARRRALRLSSWPRLVRLRLLRSMWMRRAGIDLELHDLLAAKPRLRQHALNSKAQNPIRVARHHPPVWNGLEAAGVARVAVVGLLVFLAAGHMYLLGVDNHHKIAAVQVRAASWLMLT